MSLQYLVKREMLTADTCYHWVVTGRNSRIYSTSTVDPKFARCESSYYNVWRVLQEKVNKEQEQMNLHHWSERTATVTENGLGKAGSCVIAAVIHQCRGWKVEGDQGLGHNTGTQATRARPKAGLGVGCGRGRPLPLWG